MANNLLTIAMIVRESLRVLENSLTFTKQIERQWDDRFGIAGAKIGTVINLRKPPRYQGRVGPNLTVEAATETSVPLALNTQRGVDIAFTSVELGLSVDDFSKRFLKPAIASVANAIDFDGIGVCLPGVYNSIGTPGTPPSAALTYLQGGQRLNEEACPVDDRKLVIPPVFVPPIVDTLKGLFQSSEDIAEQYRKGMMGIGLGFEWYMDQNMFAHTAGPLGGSPVVSGAGQQGTSIFTTGWTAAAALRLNVGDIVTFAGVFAVNPQNGRSTGALRQFTVTSAASSDASGNVTINVWPPLIPVGSAGVNVANAFVGGTPGVNPVSLSGGAAPQTPTLGGAFATVTNTPAASAVVTPLFAANSTTNNGLAFYPEAFGWGCADLPIPGGVDMAARVADDQLGMSIRAVRAYDITQDRLPTRLDILYGFAVLYAEMATRIVG